MTSHAGNWQTNRSIDMMEHPTRSVADGVMQALNRNRAKSRVKKIVWPMAACFAI